jgi:conjugal transfer ATP-binding protein TraC
MPDQARPLPEHLQRRHQIPTHLQVPDTILSVWGKGITVRQVLILLIGWSVSAQLWVHLSALAARGLIGVLLRFLLIALCAVLALLVAFKPVAGRPLEVWLLVLLRYGPLKKVWVYRPLGWDEPDGTESLPALPSVEDRTFRDARSGSHRARRFSDLVLALSLKTRPLSTARAPVKRLGSVQLQYVGVREVREQMLCLQGARYRAVIAVQGCNFLLKSEQEQLALTERYQHLLAGLTYPIQVLLRIRPFALPSQGADSASEGFSQASPWHHLARDQAAFWRDLERGRTLLSRHLYLIVPADPLPSHRPRVLRLPGLRSGVIRAGAQESDFEHARAQLDLRVTEISRQLGALGLACRRLSDQDLLALSAVCLLPEQEGGEPGRDPLLLGSVPAMQTLAGPYGPGESGGFTSLADRLAPSCVWLQPEAMYIQGTYQRVLVIDALPRFVPLGFLHPLAQREEPLTVSLFYHPADPEAMMAHLVRKRTDYHSTLRVATHRGQLEDPQIARAHQDVEDLLARLASGEERLLWVSCYLLVQGASVQELEERAERLRSTLHQMLLVARSATFEQDLAVRSCLPEGRNLLSRRFLLDSRSAAFATFLFLSTTLVMPDGLLEGITPAGDPVLLDWWAAEMRNANRLMVAPSGAGKSYKCKLDLVRMYVQRARPDGFPSGLRFQALVIDPEREYQTLCMALGGQWIRLAPGTPDHLNPLDLPQMGPDRRRQPGLVEEAGTDVLADTIQQVHTFLELALAERGPNGAGSLSSAEKGLLDRVLYQVYRQAGISRDPATHRRTPPLLQEVYDLLEQGTCGADPTGLAARLHRFVQGSLSGLFAGQTTLTLSAPLVVFDVRDLDADLRAIAYVLLARLVWNLSLACPIPRLFLIDELLSLYAHPEGARFLERLFQRARKHYLGVVGVTQHVGLLRQSSIVANCATKVLMAQEPEALSDLAELLHLSEQEVHLLSRCGKGDALLLTQQQHVFIHCEASVSEHRLATTDPREVARLSEASHEPNASCRQAIIQPLYQAGRPVETTSGKGAVHP